MTACPFCDGNDPQFTSNGDGTYDSVHDKWNTPTGCQCYGCVTQRHACTGEPAQPHQIHTVYKGPIPE